MLHASKELREAMHAHARTEYPREACGLVVIEKGRLHYLPCKNLSPSPRDQFVIDPADFERAEERGEVAMVFHSHPDASEQPSDADRAACVASGVPWIIVSVPQGLWFELEPSYTAPPLYGREFVHGLTDCYSFIRDWYGFERSIELPQYHREDEWWKQGGNLYIDQFASAGFIQTAQQEPLKVGDVLLMQVCADVPNHGAIYLGDDQIGHHLYGRLSSRDVYGGYYKKHTTHQLRYAG